MYFKISATQNEDIFCGKEREPSILLKENIECPGSHSKIL
jgi:hypothetical protein